MQEQVVSIIGECGYDFAIEEYAGIVSAGYLADAPDPGGPFPEPERPAPRPLIPRKKPGRHFEWMF